ncbi:MAG: hypothetical protein QOJ74_1329 [Ilumatobacteraceae bacterium]|jgi:hypothetical protein|nr:hypothetical protein [Ilumatobacteraceae bacterium]
MTNEFTVRTNEIFLLDEPTFVANGGEHLHFGAMDGDSVHLFAIGSAAAIRCVAQQIIAHGTASRCQS